MKLSPLFDVAEVYRLFGEATCVEVISLDGECKEVLAKIGFPDETAESESMGKTPPMRVTVIRRGEVRRFDFDDEDPALPCPAAEAETEAEEPRFLLVPDVAFYKTRTVGSYLAKYLADTPGNLQLSGEYLFADELPTADFREKPTESPSDTPTNPKPLPACSAHAASDASTSTDETSHSPPNRSHKHSASRSAELPTSSALPA